MAIPRPRISGKESGAQAFACWTGSNARVRRRCQEMPVIAGVDSSTQSTKVVLHDTPTTSPSSAYPATKGYDPAGGWGTGRRLAAQSLGSVKVLGQLEKV